MVVLVLVGFSAAVIAAIVTPGGERVELAVDAGDHGGSRGEGGSSGEGAGDSADTGSDVVGGDPASGGVVGSDAVAGGAEPGVDTVVVHVSGAVARPGVVELLIGSRVVDALAQAGGPDDEADLSALNLARPLVDGEQVHVPVEGELPPGGAASGGAAGGSSGAGASGALVNINTAGPAELESLPGVGPALAGRIIAWREQNGQFRSVDELLAVSGIGEKTLAGFRDQVTI